MTAFERRAQAGTERALQVQQKLSLLLEEQRDADAARRDYMLTRQPGSLATFGEGVGISGVLSDLEDDLADDRPRLSAIRRVRQLSSAHDALMADIVARHRAGRSVASSATERAKVLTDEMHDIILRQIAAQEQWLQARARTLKWRANGLYLALLLINVGIVGLSILVFRDMQQRLAEAIRMQDALRAANEGITTEAERRQEVEARLHHLQKMEAIGHLSNVIAHDFKNMIAGVVMSLESVRMRLSPRDLGAHDDLDLALHSTSKATDLANRLLLLGRKQALDARPTNINAVIVGLSDLLYRTIGRYRAIEVALGENLGLATVDPEQLETAIINLCLNAREAMPGGGEITIATRNLTLHEAGPPRYPAAAAGEYVALMVSDTGGGMTPDVAVRAFDPFYSTKRDADGLGLSQVHGFASQSNGHVAIFSTTGLGTTVKIILPRLPERVG